MNEAPTPGGLPKYLFQHVDSLNELAVFLWLARRRDAAFGLSLIARAVGVDDAVALGVLERLTEVGLVTRHGSAPTVFQYAMALAPPDNLLERLCAEYREE
jgi:hypothetical protein